MNQDFSWYDGEAIDSIPCDRCSKCVIMEPGSSLPKNHHAGRHPMTADWWLPEWCQTAIYRCVKGHKHILCPQCEEETVVGVDPRRVYPRESELAPLTDIEYAFGFVFRRKTDAGEIRKTTTYAASSRSPNQVVGFWAQPPGYRQKRSRSPGR